MTEPTRRSCPICWSPFTATNPRARYCSGACRVEDWRRRRATPAASTDEYRYSPPEQTGPCPTHPGCVILRCARFGCARVVHVLNQPGQPRRFCSPACRVAEHRRLN